ncbi:hypothetical protein FRC07_011117 [Ceratobasidium sp. 392]|nr:hypothetical protein FRC07_011117 [Ceratobasidium sp. 392]
MATTETANFDEATLTKAQQVFDNAAPGTLTGAETADQEGDKLADDMYQVLLAFQSTSARFAAVDSSYRSNWKSQWDELSTKYRTRLDEAKALALSGQQYINGMTLLEPVSNLTRPIDFNDAVTKKLVSGTSSDIVASNVELVKKWLDKNTSDVTLMTRSQEVSQSFLDLSNEVTVLRTLFGDFAKQKGAQYRLDLDKLQRDMANLQERINYEQGAAGQAQKVADGLMGALATIGGIFETIFTFGQSRTLFNQAQEHFQAHSRRAAGRHGLLGIECFVNAMLFAALRAEKDQLAIRSKAVAREESALHEVDNAVVVLAHDVVDVSGRLGYLASLWAIAHSNFLELRSALADTSRTRSTGDFSQATFFRLRVGIVGRTSAVFAQDMKRFTDGFDQVTAAQSTHGYRISLLYGGSDVSRGRYFNDIRDYQLDYDRSIVRIKIVSGYAVDQLWRVNQILGLDQVLT